jgi:flagellar motor protein MotB
VAEGQNKKKMLVMAGVWLGILGVGVLGWNLWWAPKKEREKQEQTVADHQQTIDKTSSQSRYKYTVNFAADAFSGYAPIRSPYFKEECGKYAIRLEYKDDGANYPQRLKDLADGKTDMATFTIDALQKCSAEFGDFPATIVALVDESKGADAMVAAGKRFPNIDALNNPDVRIVCVGNSPAETLGRVVMYHFSLDRLGKDPFELKDSAEEVYKAYQQAKPGDNKVFCMWEPYISRVIDNPDYHVLMDSGKFRGYVVDVIVARRDFLLKNEHLVENVVKSYLSTVFAHRNGMTDMVMEDAKALGEPLKKEQAEKLVKTIWWKNTQEGFAHFGMVQGTGLQHMEEICRNISDVLIKTGGMAKDPTGGHPARWYYDGIMRKLFDISWHPGFGGESVRQEKTLLALTDEEWGKLKPVGTLQVPRLVFSRGTSKINEASEATLTDLAEKLKAWPQYYLVVRGNAAKDGDVDANLKLATMRAKAASDWLAEHGVDRNRIRAESAKPNGSTTVAFILGEQPY